VFPFHIAPGLSGATELVLDASALDTPRYRRWVERRLLQTEARRLEKGPASASAVRFPRRIRFASLASGTLARLP
jgi:hypothetical protein